MPEEVWIVQHDESPHNTVLGVFSTEEDARGLAEEVGARFANGVIYAHYAIGYRYDEGPGHVAMRPTSVEPD